MSGSLYYKTILCLLLAVISIGLPAQIDGDNIFATDQIVTVNLDFPQSDFWSLLEDNYAADANEYIPAMLTLTDVTGTSVMDSVGVRLKGNSSYSHPGNKKSFKIDFNKFISGQNYDGIKKLNFSNAFKDPTLLREKLFFDLCRAAWVPAPRASFANVTFNGEPWGFYTIVEQIDDQFLDWRILEDSGNLFKAGDNFGGGPSGGGNEADLAWYGDDQTTYEERYELKTNEEINDWGDLVELIDFIDNSSDEVFAAEFGDRIEMVEYARSAALDNLFSNLDSYTGSARNYYIYHNLDTDKWEWIKWDGNEAFGSYSNGAGNMTSLSIDYHDSPRPLLSRMLENEDLNYLYRSLMCEILENYFNPEYMDARIDELVALVQESVYADDNKMYSNADFDSNIESDISGGGGPGGGTTYGLKSFVAERYASVSTQLDCDFYLGVETPARPEIRIYPNPTEGFLTLEWEEDRVTGIRLLNMQGKVMLHEFPASNFSHRLDLSTLAIGSYVAEVRGRDGEVWRLPVIRR